MLLKEKTGRIALLGLFLAINQIMIILAAVLDISSLSFLAVAAMMIGLSILEAGIGLGAAFFVASCLLGLILCPNPLYIVSYAVMGYYVLIKEVLERKFRGKMPMWALWGCKLLGFNLVFIPLLLLFPKVLLEAGESGQMLIVVWALAQAAVVLCDMVYDRVLWFYQQRIRKYKRE